MRRRRSILAHDQAHGPHHGGGHINVTPLIDVVMCLIIFFLLVGRLATQQGTPIALPATGVGDAEAQPRLVIAVAPSTTLGAPEVSLGGVPVATGELAGLLRTRLGEGAAGAAVAIRADRRLAWGEVRPVVEACREAGLVSVKLVTERAGDGGRR
jgi:biopolymer transport protein ExbD